MKKSKYQTRSIKKPLLIFIVTLAVIVISLFTLEKKGITNFYTKTPANDKPSDISKNTEVTTSSAESAQEDYDEGDYREPGNTLNEDKGSGEVIDNNGVVNENTDKSSPMVSSTGEISVYTPSTGSLLKSGQEISGQSSLPYVSYRLIDSVSGVIARGDLIVNNGTYSGSLNFSTNAAEGRLDVFGTRDDASEFSNIEIPIRFTQP